MRYSEFAAAGRKKQVWGYLYECAIFMSMHNNHVQEFLDGKTRTKLYRADEKELAHYRGVLDGMAYILGLPSDWMDGLQKYAYTENGKRYFLYDRDTVCTVLANAWAKLDGMKEKAA